MIHAEVLSKLAIYDTPTICNVIELFDIRPRNSGYVKSSTIRCNFPHLSPIVGYAATATAVAGYTDTWQQDASYPWLEEQVERFSELSGVPIVVIADSDSPQQAALFGEIMCSTYKAFGARGLVTDGAGRDIQQVQDLGDFQVFTNGNIASHGYFHLKQLYQPVTIGGLEIQPDELLHADENGITQIPKEIASQVADICDEFIASEGIILDALQQPNLSVTALYEARAEAEAMQKRLRTRVAGT